jgi:hypothetical protein
MCSLWCQTIFSNRSLTFDKHWHNLRIMDTFEEYLEQEIELNVVPNYIDLGDGHRLYLTRIKV